MWIFADQFPYLERLFRELRSISYCRWWTNNLPTRYVSRAKIAGKAVTGLSSCVWTLRGVYHHARARRLGAGATRACRGAVDAGVATAPSEGAAAAKTVRSVAANPRQAVDD